MISLSCRKEGPRRKRGDAGGKSRKRWAGMLRSSGARCKSSPKAGFEVARILTAAVYGAQGLLREQRWGLSGHKRRHIRGSTDEGIEVAVYQAVRAVGPTSPLDFDQRVQAVQAFRKLPQAAALAAANKRVSNLLSKAEGGVAAQVEAHYFDNPSEFALHAAIQQADHAVQPLAAARQYNEALAKLASLREPVDAFFEAVLVNAEDARVRANRYALLARLRGLFLGVADISVLG